MDLVDDVLRDIKKFIDWENGDVRVNIDEIAYILLCGHSTYSYIDVIRFIGKIEKQLDVLKNSIDDYDKIAKLYVQNILNGANYVMYLINQLQYVDYDDERMPYIDLIINRMNHIFEEKTKLDKYMVFLEKKYRDDIKYVTKTVMSKKGYESEFLLHLMSVY
jgi:hypothetical protein